VPQESATLESLLEDLHGSEGPTPVVIHCSAGVGRTGTFIALSHLKHLIFAQKRGNVDHGLSVFSVVRRLREQRVLMVQSKEQYELLYDFACMWIRRT
jgi:protein tyrosine phosphatase